MGLYIKMVLILLLLTGSLHSKSTAMKPISVKLKKANFFLDKNQNIYKKVSLAFLIKPASFSYDTSLDFKKAFSTTK